MVRHDDEMFKVHPESMCRDDPAVTEMRNRGYYVRDVPYRTSVHFEPERHPDTSTGVGLTIPQYPIPPGVAPVNASIDAKLNVIIDLLTELKRLLK